MRKLEHPKREEITLVGVLDALSDPIRLAILSTLARTGEHAWSDLGVPVGPSAPSHHMKALRLAGVINARNDGTQCFVSLRHDIEQLYPGLLKSILGFVEQERSGVPSRQDAVAAADSAQPADGKS
jgi:DNA-binding transcriptional ArsR family regulator